MGCLSIESASDEISYLPLVHSSPHTTIPQELSIVQVPVSLQFQHEHVTGNLACPSPVAISLAGGGCHEIWKVGAAACSRDNEH